MKSLYKIALLVSISMLVSSCKDNLNPNYQYFPNMYESVAYETYAESDAFKSPTGLAGKEGQLPPTGSLKRGFVPYDYPNTNEGYLASKVSLKSPMNPTTIDSEKAKELYEIYCAICHGNAGNGKGKLVEREKILGVPSYKDRVITEGSVFHVMTYGLNSMGSYANQLNTQERWMVANYVMQLKNK
jgi:Cytochrome C oxidase, cbb3-type, subunit III